MAVLRMAVVAMTVLIVRDSTVKAENVRNVLTIATVLFALVLTLMRRPVTVLIVLITATVLIARSSITKIVSIRNLLMDIMPVATVLTVLMAASRHSVRMVLAVLIELVTTMAVTVHNVLMEIRKGMICVLSVPGSIPMEEMIMLEAKTTSVPNGLVQKDMILMLSIARKSKLSIRNSL